MSLDLDFRTAIPTAGPLSLRADRSRARVLIVDDERGPRESLRMILSGAHEVTTAEDAVEALDVLRTEAIDLVTVDLNMPGMKGDELMRTIRAESPQTEIIIITGCGSIETAVEGIRHGVFDYLIKPFDVVQVTASVERALARRASRGRTLAFLEEVSRILGTDRDDHLSLCELEANTLAQERLRAILAEPILQRGASGPREGGPSTLEFLEVLAETIETRDLFMRGHARRVAHAADLLSARLCLGREERDHVRMAAFLHDIGKVGATSDVLAGKVLPEADRLESIQTHPAMGERLLRPLGLSPTVTATVRHHHERFDGRGYPDGLAGEDIPLAARIIAIVDAFDAMTCERPYRAARSRADAIDELRANAHTQFDPNLVEVFCDLVATGALEAIDETDARSGVGLARGTAGDERRRGAA